MVMFATTHPDYFQFIPAAKVLALEVKNSFRVIVNPQKPSQQAINT